MREEGVVRVVVVVAVVVAVLDCGGVVALCKDIHVHDSSSFNIPDAIHSMSDSS